MEASTVNLKAGTVAFMGSVTAEGTGKLFPPGAIEISNVKISTNGEDRQAAQDAFLRHTRILLGPVVSRNCNHQTLERFRDQE